MLPPFSYVPGTEAIFRNTATIHRGGWYNDDCLLPVRGWQSMIRTENRTLIAIYGEIYLLIEKI